jgi:hypothetical protein
MGPRVKFHESTTGFHGQNYVNNCGSEALKLRTSEKIAIAEQHFFYKLRLRKCFLQVAELRFRTQKRCACTPLVNRHIGLETSLTKVQFVVLSLLSPLHILYDYLPVEF